MALLSPGAVARRLGLSTSRVIQLDREGVLCAMRDSAGRRLYDAQAVERFALERERRRSTPQLPSSPGHRGPESEPQR
jgi:DNA-binding transcriptional MerR regulator